MKSEDDNIMHNVTIWLMNTAAGFKIANMSALRLTNSKNGRIPAKKQTKIKMAAALFKSAC